MTPKQIQNLVADFSHDKIKGLSIPDLEQLRDYVVEDIASIKSQIEDSKATKPPKKDRQWYAKASTALRYRGLAHQAVLTRLAAVRKAEKTATQPARDADFLQRLKQVIRSEYGDDELSRLTNMAQEMDSYAQI